MISLHSDVTERIVGCLITVHRVLGPGLAERSCQIASALEFAACGLQVATEPRYTVTYRGVVIGDHRPDFVVEDKVVVELKCVSNLDPVFSAQMITSPSDTPKGRLASEFQRRRAEGWNPPICALTATSRTGR